MIAAPILNAVSRVFTGPGKPGKSWNFVSEKGNELTLN